MKIRYLWCCMLLLLWASAEASPPFYPDQNRAYDTWVSGEDIQWSGDSYHRISIFAAEKYDVIGDYESSRVSIQDYLVEYLPVGRRVTYRSLWCPVSRDALFASKLWSEFTASVDSESASCDNQGYICEYDQPTGENCVPYGYSGIVEIHGYWDYATWRSEANVVRRFRDVWGESWMTICQENTGEWMRVGGFSIDDLYVPFASGTAYSDYQVKTCNENNFPY